MVFEGKRVLVTGAGNGIGQAIATAYANKGAQVLVNDLSNERLENTMAGLGSKATAVVGDVSDEGAVEAIRKKCIEEMGGLDIAISNAGVYPSCRFLEMSSEEWDRVMAVNARGTFLVCRSAARIMVDAGSGGAIVTISSGSARFARVGAAHYCASKAAIVMLTRVMALELAPLGIRVNSVSPGIIEVPGGQPLDDSYKAAMTAMVPEGRIGSPEDVANVVLFVTGPDAGYLNGEVISVDGGLSAGRFGIPTS